MTAAKSICTPETILKRQRVAFFFSLFNFVGLSGWSWMRIYFAIVGDPIGDRAFVFNSLGLLPIWIVSWIIGFVIVANSISKSKRVTWHGVGAIVMLAVPAIPVAAFVFVSFGRFFTTP